MLTKIKPMKRIITILLITCSTVIFAQDYKLFNSISKKLFSTYPEKSSTYSLSFDMSTSVGTDSVYYNFFKIEDLNFYSYNCDFWVGPECYKQNIPVWIGAKIEYDNIYSYNFFPDNGDTIHFDFTPVPGDTSVFYVDTIQRFSLIYEGMDTITVLSYSDSARIFKIQHTDLEGNEINSQLNGQNIIIAKDLGLIRFFQIDDFPQVLNPISLIGQENPNLGIFNITNEMLYDFQPGDEIQHRIAKYYSYGPPSWSWTKYVRHIILGRTETIDSIIYEIDELIFYEDSSLLLSNIITESYYKHDIFAQLPFEKFNGDYQWFTLHDYCDLSLWTYKFEAENWLEYCEIDDVWGYFDTNGPPPTNETTWVLGLGVYDSYGVSYNGNMDYHSSHHEIVYFKKDDIICGEIIVSESENETYSQDFLVYPNPVNDLLNINNFENNNPYDIEIRNAFGQLVMIEDDIQLSHYRLNVTNLKVGLYFYVIKEKGEVLQQGKVIKK